VFGYDASRWNQHLFTDIIKQANVATASNPQPHHARRSMVMLAILIAHPTKGLILFETGAGKDYPSVWGPQLNDLFTRENYIEDQELDAAIKKTGNDIKNVKAVIIGHLHLDHAGGLEQFRGTNVPIYVHELEIKHAFYSVATKTDLGKMAFSIKLILQSYRSLIPNQDAITLDGYLNFLFESMKCRLT
jgi:glyoxylase-like metal-dependent hydrolase (beta-lactamase superfamily II)